MDELCQPNTAAATTCVAHSDGGTWGCSTCASGTCNVPTRVGCKTKGLVRSRFRLAQTDPAGSYRLVGTIRVPEIGVPTSGVLRLAMSVNGAPGRDYEAAAATSTAVTGKRPAFFCSGP